VTAAGANAGAADARGGSICVYSWVADALPVAFSSPDGRGASPD